MSDLIQTVRSVLEITPSRWQALLASLPPDLLTRQPAPGEWSAVDCLGHLVDTEQWVFSVRLQAFLEGKDSFPAFDPDAEGTPPEPGGDPVRLGERFTGLRRSNLALLDRMSEADLTRVARHAELGPVTLAEMLNHWAAHDFNHTVQAERALMQPFILGCGPWESYFIDHIAVPPAARVD